MINYTEFNFLNSFRLILATKNEKIVFIGTREYFYNYFKNIKEVRNNCDETSKLYIENFLKYNKNPLIIKEMKFEIINGTKFQKEIWETLTTIEAGKTSTYSEIANKCNNPNASRAVGNIIGQNPILLIIPCHRVLRKDGTLGGFSAGIELKKQLIEIETNFFRG